MRKTEVFALFIAACSANAGPVSVASPPVVVRTATVTHENLSRPVRAAGVLVAKQELTLGFKTGGIIEAMLVEEGATVRKGQLLARLNLTEVEAQMRQTEEALNKAERDHTRAVALVESHAITVSDLQNATSAFEVAKATLAAARFNLQLSSIIAPEDGRVQKRFAEARELVAPGTPVFRVSTNNKGLVVRVGLSDRDIVRVALGDPAQVSFAAFAEPFTARVSEVGAIASPRTGTYEVELRLETPGAVPLSGMVAKAEIHPAATHALAVVPVEALLEGNGAQADVFALTGSTPHRTHVQVAFIDNGRAAIASGLEHVDTVVTDGAAYLRDDSTVEVSPHVAR